MFKKICQITGLLLFGGALVELFLSHSDHNALIALTLGTLISFAGLYL